MGIVGTSAGGWHWQPATAVCTGKAGAYGHFFTPVAVFAQSLDNLDFRSEGTFNKNHIRGYGVRGRRIFDFGWQFAERGWDGRGESRMRLQMHTTEPRSLDARLGQVVSEGCIRIPATLDVFLDSHGLLDADYQQAVKKGQELWVIKANHQTILWQAAIWLSSIRTRHSVPHGHRRRPHPRPQRGQSIAHLALVNDAHSAAR